MTVGSNTWITLPVYVELVGTTTYVTIIVPVQRLP